MNGRLRRVQIVSILAITQLIGWGTSSDLLGVLGRIIARDLHVPNEIAFLGLAVSLICSGFLGPQVGAWLRRFKAGPVLSGGSICLSTGLVILASAHDVMVYFLAWLVLGLGAALGLSAGAYAAIVEREGVDSKRVIGTLMIMTGLSSAIFWPLLSELTEFFGWRMTCLIAASAHIVICLPLHLLALPKPLVHREEGQALVDRPPIDLSPAQHKSVFILIAFATTIFSFTGLGMSASVIELLHRSGATQAFAIQLGSTRSVLAILARLADLSLGKRSTPVRTSIAACVLIMTGSAVLLLFNGATPVLIAFIVLNGFGAGIASLARVLLPLSFFAVSDYGRQASRLMLPQNFANAAAPVIFNALLDHGGVSSVLSTLLALALAALACFMTLASIERRARMHCESPPV